MARLLWTSCHYRSHITLCGQRADAHSCPCAQRKLHPHVTSIADNSIICIIYAPSAQAYTDCRLITANWSGHIGLVCFLGSLNIHTPSCTQEGLNKRPAGPQWTTMPLHYVGIANYSDSCEAFLKLSWEAGIRVKDFHFYHFLHSMQLVRKTVSHMLK
jgi:hypothetical protein